MINDTIFTDELNILLKKRKIKVKDRRATIKKYLDDDDINSCRDKVLDRETYKTQCFLRSHREKNNVPSEFTEQCNFVKWFKSEYPHIVIMSIRNGGHRNPRERSEQLLEGLHPGAADLYIPAWKLWIEFKKIKGGVLSEKQEIFRDYVLGIGDNWILALGCEDGKSKLYEKN